MQFFFTYGLAGHTCLLHGIKRLLILPLSIHPHVNPPIHPPIHSPISLHEVHVSFPDGLPWGHCSPRDCVGPLDPMSSARLSLWSLNPTVKRTRRSRKRRWTRRVVTATRAWSWRRRNPPMTREARKQPCEASCSLGSLFIPQPSIAWISKLSSNKEASSACPVSMCRPPPCTPSPSACALSLSSALQPPAILCHSYASPLGKHRPTVPFLFSDGPEPLSPCAAPGRPCAL